jgi:putative ABC transport system permease protein
MERLRQDLRFGVRMLLRHRGFTAAALLMLALGIGSNVVVFSLARTMYFRRLQVPHGDRLVAASGTVAGGNQDAPLSLTDFRYVTPGRCRPSRRTIRTRRSTSSIAATRAKSTAAS